MGASQPSSETDICNLALDRIGQAPISSIDPPATQIEDVLARHYPATRRALLRDFIFHFAKKPSVLVASGVAPAHPDFATGYALPTDFIRLLTIGDKTLFMGNVTPRFYDISQGFLYCDLFSDASAPGNSLQIAYMFDQKLVGLFDAGFVVLLYTQLAADIAYKFTLKGSLKKDLDAELMRLRAKAAAISGQEQPPRRVQRSRLRDVRRSGGIFRNNTVINGP